MIGLATAVAVSAWMLLLTAPAKATVFSNPASIALNDPNSQSNGNNNATATPYPSTISVSGLTGTVSQVAVTLTGVTYSHSQDIDALLVGPGGQTLILVSNLGPNSGPGAAVSGGTLTFSDAGVLPPSGMATSWSALSTIKPVNYGGFNQVWESPAPAGPYGDPGTAGSGATLASTFNGSNPNGTWSLYVITTAGGDGTGQIANGWSLDITAAAATASTTTAVSSDNNPSFTTAPGSGVTFTATVQKSSDNSNVNEGTVAFTDGGTTISGCDAVAVSAGQATCATNFSAEGAHSVKAAYSGTANFGASSATLTQVVNNHTTVTGSSYCNAGSIALNDPNSQNNGHNNATATPYPSNVFVSGLTGTVSQVAVTLTGVTYSHSQDIDALLVGPGGQTLILVSNLGPNSGPGAAVSGGTLTFSDAGVLPPSGMATSWSALSTIKPVNYGGFNQVWESPAPAGPYGDPGTAGSGATLASTFNGSNPNGTWSLYLITTAGGDGTGQIAGGWCANITAAAATASTTTAVSSDNNPSFTTAPGSGVTFTATVQKSSDNSNVNEGTVAFTDGGTTISGCDAVAVSAGQATCATNFSAEGAHSVKAGYSGTANFGASSATLTQVVNNHTTVTGSNYCNAGSIALNDPNSQNNGHNNATATPYPSNVFVAGRAGPITNVTVTLNSATYSHSQDIDALLVGPGGQTLILVSNLGPNSGPGAAVSGGTLTFSDAGVLPPSGMATSWSALSTIKPVNYGGFNQVWESPAPAGPYGDPGTAGSGATLASTFNGSNPNGTWSLYLITTAGGDGTGQITGGWCLGIAIQKATPTVATQVSSTRITAGHSFTASASFTGAPAGADPPTGSAIFRVYGPNDTGCTKKPVFTSVNDVNTTAGTTTALSGQFTPMSVGFYRVTVVYHGDSNYAQVITRCRAANGLVYAGKALSAIVTQASASVTVGGMVSDQATLSGGVSATGTITFSLYGPNKACSGTPIFTTTATVAGNGSYPSAPFTTTAAGTYRWVAAYSGDANNAAKSDACNVPNETVVVTSVARSSRRRAAPRPRAGRSAIMRL